MSDKTKYLTAEQVLADIGALPKNYKTADIDRLIKKYIADGADVSMLRPHILEHQELHRIYYFVSLKPMKSVGERMDFIDKNLLFSDWWHTDQLIGFVADLDFDTALRAARGYISSEDEFIKRWGYVLFISKLCRGHAKELWSLLSADGRYYVQMAEAWLIAELAVFEPETVLDLLSNCELGYGITGKAVQKICDSFRISSGVKEQFRALRPKLKMRGI